MTIWVIVTALVSLGSLTVPEVYQSNARVEVTQAAKQVADPSHSPAFPKGETREGMLAAFADDPKLLGDIAAKEGLEPSKAVTDQIRSSIQVRWSEPTIVEIAFRSHGAETAQQGCRALSEALVARITKDSSTGGAGEAKEALERATKQLTDFLVAHPDAPPDPNATAGSAAPKHVPSGTDPAIAILRQEKARIEAEIATAEALKDAPHQNPYEDPSDAVDVAKLKQRLGEIHNAIVAHQRAIAAMRDATPVSAPSPKQATNVEEWRRLVRGVTDATRAAFAPDAGPALTAKIVSPASLPDAPLESLRRLIALSAGFFGMVLAGMWAGFRTWRLRRRDVSSMPPRSISSSSLPAAELRPSGSEELAVRPSGSEELAVRPSGSEEPPRRSSGPAPMPVRSPLPARPPGSSVPPIGEAQVRIPPAPAVPTFGPGRTQIGMIDPAAFAAQTAPAAPRARLESLPIVDITRDRGAAAGATAGSTTGTRRSEPPRPGPSSNPPAVRGRSEAAKIDGSSVRTQIGPSRSPAVKTVGGETLKGSGGDTKRESSVPPSARPRPNRSPVSEETSPVTQRMGSPSDREGDKEARPRSDAPSQRRASSYSFVDHDATSRRRASSRSTGTQPGHAPADATAGTMVDDRTPPTPTVQTGVVVTSARASEPPPVAVPVRASEVPKEVPAQVVTPPEPTKPVWRQPTPTGLALHSSSRRGVITSRPPEPLGSEFINPRSAPPSWRGTSFYPEGDEDAELNALRDQLLDLCKDRPFVVGVTSEPEFGAGKSQTAARLATLIAADGRARVLLLDADFEYPVVQRLMAIDMPHGSGFSQQMRARIKTGEQKPWVVVTCSPTLHVLGEGVMRTPGLLFSQEFSEAIAELRRCYDVIVADGPVVGIGADHKPLDAAADGLVFVVRSGAPLNEALDRAVKYFKRKEFVAVVSSAVPVEE